MDNAHARALQNEFRVLNCEPTTTGGARDYLYVHHVDNTEINRVLVRHVRAK